MPKAILRWTGPRRALRAALALAALALPLAGVPGCGAAEPRPREQGPKAVAAEDQDRAARKPEDAASGGNGIAARVNDEIITWKDVDDRLKLPAKEITFEIRRSKRLELAEERLFLQWARKNNITVSDQEIDEMMRREMKAFAREEQFDAGLRSSGLTRTEYRERLRRAILAQKLYWHLVRKAQSNPDADTPGLMQDYVSPEEIRRYYEAHREQYRAIENVSYWRIGLQYTNPKEKEGKRALAESILRKIEEGSDFYLMAGYYSDVWRGVEEGGRSQRVYGDRGLKREDARQFFSPETVKFLFETMKVGEMSGIVEDGQTLNIFRLDQRVSQKEETFEEAQNKIRSYLEHRNREENRRRLRNELVRRSYVWPPDLFEGK